MLKHLHTFDGHQNPVYALANSNESNLFFSAGNDKGIVEWSLAQMSFVKVKLPVKSSVYVMHRHENLLFIGERSGKLSVYELTEQKLIIQIDAHTKPIFDIKTIASKNEILTTGEDGWVAVWSLHSYQEIYRFPVATDTIRCMAVSPNETEVALGCKNHSIYIYNLSDYTLKHRIEGHTFPVTALAYHPLYHYLISGSRDAQLKIWDVVNYELIRNIPAHLFTIYQIAYHPTLPIFATCSQDKTIKLWDATNFKLYKILSIEKTATGHTHSINKIIWNTDGKYLISTGDDRKVMVWEFESSMR